MNKEYFKRAFIFVILLAVSFVVVAIPVFYGEKKACQTWEAETNREAKFISSFPWYADCLTKTEFGWIPIENLQNNELIIF